MTRLTNLGNRPPLGLKNPKKKPNKKWLAEVHQMKCVICVKFSMVQLSPTQAHHPIHDRFSGAKVSDDLAIPLCEGHHQGFFDTSKIALHKEPKLWRETYGADYTYCQKTST